MKDVCALPLGKGAHSGPEEGFCVVEMASYLAHETWSDSPKCASPVIAAFLRSWNDSMNDEDRQMLKPYAFKVIGTNTGESDDVKRSWMALDWLCRVQTPAWLRLAGLTAEAQALEALARIVDSKTARLAQPALDVSRTKAAAAGAAAWAAAWAAARAAARDAAWDAAGAAAWDAAGAAARDAAGAAAWAAARDAAWAAARDAAWAAARDELRPTVVALQKSALVLLDEMIAVGRAA